MVRSFRSAKVESYVSVGMYRTVKVKIWNLVKANTPNILFPCNFSKVKVELTA